MKWEDDKTVLYLLAFCMAPVVVVTMPGFGGINNLVAFTFQDFLALLLLVPVLLSGKVHEKRIRQSPKSHIFCLFCSCCHSHLSGNNIYKHLRIAFGLALSMLVPFLAFQHYHQHRRENESVIHAMIFAALSLALVGVFEFVKHWHVYELAFGSWARCWLHLFAVGSSGHLDRSDPIPFGTVFMVGIGLCLGTSEEAAVHGRNGRFLIALLLGGLVSPFARGPWLGAVVILVVFLLTGPNPVGVS